MPDERNKDRYVEFEVSGDYALFADPILRLGGEKCSYMIPTYEALKGILASCYWKPTFVWYIDEVRVMNPIQTESKTILRTPYMKESKELSFYNYLKNCRYQVRAHLEWNMNRPEMENDRNYKKHIEIARRMIAVGGRRDVYLGLRSCQGYVEPCAFGEGKGAYDDLPELAFGMLYHGLTYPDEAYSRDTDGMMTANFWFPVMKNGVIKFTRPEDCPLKKPIRKMSMKRFPPKQAEGRAS